MFSRQSHESRILWSQEMHEGTGSSATGSSGPRPSPIPALPTTSDSSSLCLWPDKHKSSSRMTASPSVLIMSGVRLRYPFHWTWPSQLCTVSSNWGWTKLWLVSSFKQQLTLNFMLSCAWLFGDPMNCSPSGYSVHGIFQARILKWVAIFSSRRSSQPRDGTHICCTGRILHR